MSKTFTAMAKTYNHLGEHNKLKACPKHPESFFSILPDDYDTCVICREEEKEKAQKQKINAENAKRLQENTIPNTTGGKVWCGRCQQMNLTVQSVQDGHYCCAVCGTDNNIPFRINKYGKVVPVGE